MVKIIFMICGSTLKKMWDIKKHAYLPRYGKGYGSLNIGFAAVLMKHGNVLYVGQYTNYLQGFDKHEITFIEILK